MTRGIKVKFKSIYLDAGKEPQSRCCVFVTNNCRVGYCSARYASVAGDNTMQTALLQRTLARANTSNGLSWCEAYPFVKKS